MVVTSYGRNKNHDKEINKKNQEKANNSLSYRFAAIKKDMENSNALEKLLVTRTARSEKRYTPETIPS